MNTYHIHISGIVQGVGFRPYVYQLAMHFGLTGWVNNTNDGIHFEFNAESETAIEVYTKLTNHPPKLATITNHSIKQIDKVAYPDFNIIESESDSNPELPLTPDFALCDDCRKEVLNNENRRSGYAFTTCTNCGPRYSIINKMPYDRPFTTMAKFSQCPPCTDEYNNPLNRRHYSQTNSCHDCGITLFSETEHKNITIEEIVNYLKDEKIIAIKGIGGFLLMCDANNPEVTNKLRDRKNRPSKPFAVMYPSLEQIRSEYQLHDKAARWFTNEVSPIILLKPKHDKISIDRESIAPGLNRVGCMIPYAPLLELVLQQFGKPIVATSGNISGSPIIYDNKEASDELSVIADVVISNDREIVIPQDDSVITFTHKHQHKIILRRSRGLAPTYLQPKFDLVDKSILAVGAQMKSSFTLTHRKLVYISQYLGDMDSYLTQKHYEKTIDHFNTIFNPQLNAIVGDMHPDYYTTHFGSSLSDNHKLPFMQVQHHEAHFYAILAEHGLLDSTEKILGVIWDGTGYGYDGMIWGGEFFNYNGKKMERCSHLPYFPFILGDKMPREPRISALALCSSSDILPDLLKTKFTNVEWSTYQEIITSSNLKTSSMGRVFDAVASILLNLDKTSFEGEAAMQLEASASSHIASNGIENMEPYQVNLGSFDSLVIHIINDIENGIQSEHIAARFHLTLVHLIRQQAEETEAKVLAFSGGVFQNGLLVDMIISVLGDEFDLRFHKELSPNDENISFGQLAWYLTNEN